MSTLQEAATCENEGERKGDVVDFLEGVQKLHEGYIATRARSVEMGEGRHL